MIALGGPKLKHECSGVRAADADVSMIALGGPKLKLLSPCFILRLTVVSMIALGGPKLKLVHDEVCAYLAGGFNDSTGWA